MRDDKFTTPSGIVNLHPTKGTHWVKFSDKFCFEFLIKFLSFLFLSFLISFHMDAHLQLIYSITLIREAPSVMVFIQNIKIRNLIVIVQHIVRMCCTSQLYQVLKMQYRIYIIKIYKY